MSWAPLLLQELGINLDGSSAARYAARDYASCLLCSSTTLTTSRPDIHLPPPLLLQELDVIVDGSRTPQMLTTELAKQATLFVTMGCGESCPYVPGLERQDWYVPVIPF